MNDVYEIQLIVGKNISTKNIADNNVSIFVSIPTNLYNVIHKYVNKVLELHLTKGGTSFILNCNINNDGSTPIMYNAKEGHGVLKLDVILEDKMVLGYIVSSDLFLKI